VCSLAAAQLSRLHPTEHAAPSAQASRAGLVAGRGRVPHRDALSKPRRRVRFIAGQKSKPRPASASHGFPNGSAKPFERPKRRRGSSSRPKSDSVRFTWRFAVSAARLRELRTRETRPLTGESPVAAPMRFDDVVTPSVVMVELATIMIAIMWSTCTIPNRSLRRSKNCRSSTLRETSGWPRLFLRRSLVKQTLQERGSCRSRGASFNTTSRLAP